MFDKFLKNDRIRAVNPNIAQTVGDIVMRKVNSQLCEDALCLNCVPGFCRMRPTPLPNLSNMTVIGLPNITSSSRQNLNITKRMGSGFANSTAVTNQQMRQAFSPNATVSVPPINGSTTPAPLRVCTCSWI